MVGVKRIVTIFSLTLITVALAMVVLFNWSALGWKALSVPTGSMKPAISPGSLVLVHRVPINSLKVGDVITYINPLNPKATISHRIVKTYMISGKVPGFVTKGDANKVPDIPIASGSVEGKVIVHVPDLGAWMMWTRTPWGMLPFIWLPALLIMFEEVRRLSDYFKSQQPYRLPGFGPVERPATVSKMIATSGTLGLTFVIAGAFLWQPALALIKSNTVMLANNRLSVAANVNQCSGNTSNNTSVSVNNSSTQTATSGSASSSGNTNGGTATSGSASNSNSTTTTVTVKNC